MLSVISGLSLRTRVSNLKSVALTVLELLAFNSHDRPLRTHTHTHTHTHTQTDRQTDKHKRTHYLRHSLRSLVGDNKISLHTVEQWVQQCLQVQSNPQTNTVLINTVSFVTHGVYVNGSLTTPQDHRTIMSVSSWHRCKIRYHYIQLYSPEGSR